MSSIMLQICVAPVNTLCFRWGTGRREDDVTRDISATEATSRSVALVDAADMVVSGSSAHGALVRSPRGFPSVRRRPVFVGQVTGLTPSDVGHPARMPPITWTAL